MKPLLTLFHASDTEESIEALTCKMNLDPQVHECSFSPPQAGCTW